MSGQHDGIRRHNLRDDAASSVEPCGPNRGRKGRLTPKRVPNAATLIRIAVFNQQPWFLTGGILAIWRLRLFVFGFCFVSYGVHGVTWCLVHLGASQFPRFQPAIHAFLRSSGHV